MKRKLILSLILTLSTVCGMARQPERGYRGFAELGGRIYNCSYGYFSNTHFSPGISTSHGFQFNSWLFAGAGIDYTLDDGKYLGDHNYDPDNYLLSIFAHGRTDLKLGKLTPFCDVRLGWNASSCGTVYFSPSIGYRFNWGRKVGINLGIGYTLDAFRYQKYIAGIISDGYTALIPTGEYYNQNNSSFTFRVGVDF